VIALDTNILVRFIVHDEPVQTRLVRERIYQLREADERALVTDIVLCELIWVLESSYDFKREELEEVLKTILLTRQFEVENRRMAWAALEDYRQSGADYADCLLGRTARAAGCEETITFDREAARLPYYRLLGPGEEAPDS
jgi:predicted nucleic-acid-binding protein